MGRVGNSAASGRIGEWNCQSGHPKPVASSYAANSNQERSQSRGHSPGTARIFVPNRQERALQVFRTLTAAGAIAAAAFAPAVAADISGAGATFPYPVYAKWADAYKKQTGVGLNYQSIGSGGGIKQI